MNAQFTTEGGWLSSTETTTKPWDPYLFWPDFVPPVLVAATKPAAEITDTLDNSTMVLNTSSEITYALCSMPAFCERKLDKEEQLHECGKAGTIGIFLTGFLLLALLIIASNVIVIILTFKYPSMRSRLGYMKLSLAVVDLMIGINVLCAMSAGYASTINMTPEELLNKTIESINSPASVVSGGILIFSFEGAIFHLMFMSIERFFAIRYPILHRTSRKIWIFVILSVTWSISLLYSFIPTAFPNHFRYSYVPMLLMYEMSSIEQEYKTLDIQGPILFSFGIIVPYILTVIFTALTGYSAWKHIKDFSKIQDSGSQKASKEKPEIEALKTTAIMILTFTLAKVPITVVYMMFYAKGLNCQNFSTPYTVAFFFSISNSFLNVAIYSFRDRNFRSSFKKIVAETNSFSIKIETRSTSI